MTGAQTDIQQNKEQIVTDVMSAVRTWVFPAGVFHFFMFETFIIKC